MGGVRTGQDALEFVLAGASAVSVGTTIFNDPSAPVRVLAELRMALAERGFTRFADAIGYAHRDTDEPPAPGTEPDPDSATALDPAAAPGQAAPASHRAAHTGGPSVVDVRGGDGPAGGPPAEPPRGRPAFFEDQETRGAAP
jgi:hypothetical protein